MCRVLSIAEHISVVTVIQGSEIGPVYYMVNAADLTTATITNQVLKIQIC